MISRVKSVLKNIRYPDLFKKWYKHVVTEKRTIYTTPSKASVYGADDYKITFKANKYPTANFVKGKVKNGYLKYEPHETSIFMEAASQAQVIFDLGAHVGYYSLLGSTYEGVKSVVSFEPLPRLASEIRRHARRNSLDEKICIVQKTVSDLNGNVDFENSFGHTSQRGVSLDMWCNKHEVHPDLIKIDVEGFEVSVLRGCKKVLENRPTILLEVHPEFIESHGDNIDTIWNILSEYGYNSYILMPNGDIKSIGRELQLSENSFLICK